MIVATDARFACGVHAAVHALAPAPVLALPDRIGSQQSGQRGAASCLVTDAISYVISALLLWSLPRPARLPGGGADGRMRDLILEGRRFGAEHPVLRRMPALNTVVNLLGGGLLALTPVLLVRDLHEPAFVLGLVYACEGAGGLIGATLAP